MDGASVSRAQGTDPLETRRRRRRRRRRRAAAPPQNITRFFSSALLPLFWGRVFSKLEYSRKFGALLPSFQLDHNTKRESEAQKVWVPFGLITWAKLIEFVLLHETRFFLSGCAFSLARTGGHDLRGGFVSSKHLSWFSSSRPKTRDPTPKSPVSGFSKT